MSKIKIVYATIKLMMKDNSDIDEVSAEADYNFRHDDIVATEWIATEEKNDE